MSGLSAAIGYLLGTLAGYGVAALLRRLGRTPSPRVRRRGWLALGVVAVVVVVAGLALWPGWQNQQRDLVGMEHVAPAVLAPMVAATLVVFGVLFLVGRLVGHGIVLLDRLLARRLPRLVAHAITAAVFAGRRRGRDPRRRRRRVPRLGQPPLRGRRHHHRPRAWWRPPRPPSRAARRRWCPGRPWASTAAASSPRPPARPSCAPSTGRRRESPEPIRVYVGLRSAGSPDERAALAVRELERTGAFGREVLAVVTTTGTGWVDPDAASSLEYLHGGDTALVGLQYSYLPSWISFLVDRDEAAEAGAALYRHVHRRWSQLPAESRPKLIIFGESLGSFGAEAAFGAPTPRRRWPTSSTGRTARCSPAPPRPTGSGTSSPTTGSRAAPSGAPSTAAAPGSGSPTGPPTWSAPTRPGRSRASSTCTIPRTRSGTGAPTRSGGGRSGPSTPRGYDVPARAGWFPIVTGVQEVADLIAGFSAPSGYGHNYGSTS